MIELFIETLTGAAFELRVSPFETIMAVKSKIQRLEGIPISQQHLIWQTVELDDDYCLHDYDIHNGATLKLVLAMRGGPINTRRVPIEDSSVLEYVESSPDELLEKVAGSRQVTLLVFREGDQLNFFRVVDRGDGTLTPLSESLSAASMYNMYDEEEESEGASKEMTEENARIREKINSLRSKMDNMSVSKKTRKMIPAPPQGRPSGSARLQSIRSGQLKPSSALNRNLCLPPVSQKPSQSSSQYNSMTALSAQVPSVQQHRESTIPELKAKDLSLSPHAAAETPHQSMAGAVAASSMAISTNTSSAGKSKAAGSRSTRQNECEQMTNYRIKSIPEDEEVDSGSRTRLLRSSKAHDKASGGGERLREASRGSLAVHEGAHPPLLRRSSSRLYEVRSSSRQHSDHLTLETLKDSFHPQRITLESLSSNEARMMSGLLQQASLERLGTSSISNFSPVRTRRSFSSQVSVDDGDRILEKAMSAGHSTVEHLESISTSSAKLPPVKAKKKGGKSKRCYFCAKKTGLATSYMCRCGNNFCATHRYAEMHDCTFDYKTEGRQLLEQNNPVVSAPKLPKI